MQYREELVAAANDIFGEIESRRIKVLNQIQLHAISQIKSGYTSFRISKLKKSDEKFLTEWAKLTNTKVSEITFKCFENEKKYVIKQFSVDLKDCANFEYELEGNTLIIV